MEVVFKNMLQAYSGKCDGLVYYYNKRLNKVIARRLPQNTLHEGNRKLSAVSRNLKALNLSEAYKTDMKLYTEMLRMKDKEASTYSWSNVFRKLMYAVAKQYALDLAVLNREYIETNNLPCITVKAAVDAGFLPAVEGYTRFDNFF